MAVFAIKAEIADPAAERFAFAGAKTMYAGKTVRPGDTVFLFASETSGGAGLIAKGIAVEVEAVPRIAGVERQTPRIGLVVARTATALRPLGRAELKSFDDWGDGRPEAELNFKYYRQATDKVVGLSPAAAAFLETFF